MIIFRLSDFEAKAKRMPRAYCDDVLRVGRLSGNSIKMAETDYAFLKVKWHQPKRKSPAPQPTPNGRRIYVGPTAQPSRQLLGPTGKPLLKKCCGMA